MLDNKDIEKLSEVFATKEEIVEFKDEILTGQDEILTKIDTLLIEKPIKDAQDKRKTDVLKIHNVALKKNKILSEKQVSEIDKLRVF